MAHRTADASFSGKAHEILKQLCSTPTAPFGEGRVVRYVEQFVKQRRKLRLSRDRFGNLLIVLPGKPNRSVAHKNSSRWVFTAHMDHPGFIATEMKGDRTLHARFHGGVEARYFVKSRVRFFLDHAEVRGVVNGYETDADKRPIAADIRVSQSVPAGTIGMWDVGEGRIRGKKFFSRVCDDLAGAAAALAMLDALHRNPPTIDIAVLLTRAEEEGFIGALAASIHPTLLRKSDRLVAIECSAAQPYAPQGAGAIIRVGDRLSVFNSSLTYFLSTTAADLAKNDRQFRFQRALMPGGACEATVYDIYGFTAASICVPLANYHNMDKARGKIAPEFIHLGDWESMVKLFIALAKNGHSYQPGHTELKQRLVKRFEKFRPML
jgi:endoglucanase